MVWLGFRFVGGYDYVSCGDVDVGVWCRDGGVGGGVVVSVMVVSLYGCMVKVCICLWLCVWCGLMFICFSWLYW